MLLVSNKGKNRLRTVTTTGLGGGTGHGWMTATRTGPQRPDHAVVFPLVTSPLRRTAVGFLAAAALALSSSVLVAAPAEAATVSYKNCTAFQKTYKHGVAKSGARDKVKGKTKPVTTFKRSTKIYKAAIKANKRLDADKDGVACEKR